MSSRAPPSIHVRRLSELRFEASGDTGAPREDHVALRKNASRRPLDDPSRSSGEIVRLDRKTRHAETFPLNELRSLERNVLPPASPPSTWHVVDADTRLHVFPPGAPVRATRRKPASCSKGGDCTAQGRSVSRLAPSRPLTARRSPPPYMIVGAIGRDVASSTIWPPSILRDVNRIRNKRATTADDHR